MHIKYLFRSMLSALCAMAICIVTPLAVAAMDMAWPSAPVAAKLDLEHAVRNSDPTQFIEIGLLKPVYEESYRTAGQSLADPPVFV